MNVLPLLCTTHGKYTWDIWQLVENTGKPAILFWPTGTQTLPLKWPSSVIIVYTQYSSSIPYLYDNQMYFIYNINIRLCF